MKRRQRRSIAAERTLRRKSTKFLSSLSLAMNSMMTPSNSQYELSMLQSGQLFAQNSISLQMLHLYYKYPRAIDACYTLRMKFKALQENLRQTLWERIEGGELTGLRLAQQTGFKQAHISNFLNRKRGLSLEGMDRVLNVQHLSVLDLIDPAEVNKRASILPPGEDEFDNVVVADPHIAASEALIMSMHVKEILKFKKSFLKRLREGVEGDRRGWERFVVIKADAQGGAR